MHLWGKEQALDSYDKTKPKRYKLNWQQSLQNKHQGLLFDPVDPRRIVVPVMVLNLFQRPVFGVRILEPLFGVDFQNDKSVVFLTCDTECFGLRRWIRCSQCVQEGAKIWKSIQRKGARTCCFVDFVGHPAHQVCARMIQAQGTTHHLLLLADFLDEMSKGVPDPVSI